MMITAISGWRPLSVLSTSIPSPSGSLRSSRTTTGALPKASYNRRVATPTRATRRWSLLIAFGIVVLVGGLYLAAPVFLQVVELALYDQHFRLRGGRTPGPQVAIVAIDEASLRGGGGSEGHTSELQ